MAEMQALEARYGGEKLNIQRALENRNTICYDIKKWIDGNSIVSRPESAQERYEVLKLNLCEVES